MINDFFKSLGFLGMDVKNSKYTEHPKNLYKFDDEQIDKQWRCFYAFYQSGVKQGRINTLNEVSIDCINKLKELG